VTESTRPQDRIGLFVAGGPAAGINAVVKGVVLEADNRDVRVLGYLNGAHGLLYDRFVTLTRRMVEDIHATGGSVVGTSRFRIDEARGDVQTIVRNLEGERIDGLISIGGEGTLQLANVLRRAGVNVVHVPKTIDNDIAGVAQSFGFDTAVHEASRMLSAIKLDAESCGLWFVVEIMGRYTGHLAVEAGLASACTRVLIPEEGLIDVDSLVALIDARARSGLDWGVILVAESAHFGEGHITRYGRLGGVADELAQRLERRCAEREVACKIRTSNLGYCLRAGTPTGFDRSYAIKLGLGAARLLLRDRRFGVMVTVEDNRLGAVPMENVAGVMKKVDLSGVPYRSLQCCAEYESTRIEAEERRRLMAGAARILDWLDRNADMETARELAMRLGVEPETLLAVLQDMRDARPPGSPVVWPT
jgi:6-phosphofructokinase 1